MINPATNDDYDILINTNRDIANSEVVHSQDNLMSEASTSTGTSVHTQPDTKIILPQNVFEANAPRPVRRLRYTYNGLL